MCGWMICVLSVLTRRTRALVIYELAGLAPQTARE